jgi:predicted GIY-YIG superfamily endonuclease
MARARGELVANEKPHHSSNIYVRTNLDFCGELCSHRHMPAYVYILASRKNGTLYTGVTSDISQRVWEHKEEITGGFTKNTASSGWSGTATMMTSAMRSSTKSASRDGAASGNSNSSRR